MGTAKRLMTLPVGSRAANALLFRQKLLPQSSCQCPVLKAASEARRYTMHRVVLHSATDPEWSFVRRSRSLPALARHCCSSSSLRQHCGVCAGSLAIGGQSRMQVRAAVQPGAMNCKRCRRHANALAAGDRQALLSCRQCKLPMQSSSANAFAAKRRQCNALGQQAVARSVKMHRILLP